MEINNNNNNNNDKEDESRVETDVSESTNDINNDHNKWTNAEWIFRRIYKNEQNLNDEKAKSNNKNRYELLNDFETLYYSNENKIKNRR